MRKLKENPDAKLRTVQGMMAETNLSRYLLMRIADEAEAVIRISQRGIRIDVDRFYAYLETKKTGQEDT